MELKRTEIHKQLKYQHNYIHKIMLCNSQICLIKVVHKQQKRERNEEIAYRKLSHRSQKVHQVASYRRISVAMPFENSDVPFNPVLLIT